MTSPTHEPKPKRRVSPTPARDFWADIRERFNRYLLLRNEGLGPIAREDLQQRLRQGLHVLAAEVEKRARRLEENQGLDQTSPSRRDVAAACRILGMDPPRRGRLPDLRRAARQKKALSRMYHPDVGGEGANRASFEAVITAYETIEAYVASAQVVIPTTEPEVTQATETEIHDHDANEK